ncbi:uncharacterized protein At4g06598 [Beta vulgaris subsp. vulgaris]|uniref:uncharacterized protein At4g06598 n=1 Tax=Beta vulgaris subsp. vulgaris TaxID=3555 RepID=UPI00203695D5|nr:uncharacterized protein At4g06598 [Beta vulgaris subsp. vulgaris]XP_048498496.1 uncharacterized protein At4g06598 [Beta vulgaris subsp. vulgaris]
MLTEYMANPNGFANIQVAPCRGRMSLPPKGPSQPLYYGPTHTDKQVNMPRTCSEEVLFEEPPAWLEDLLNEPDSPANRSHRRAASDSCTYFGADSNANELWLRNIIGTRPCSFQMPRYFNGAPAQGSFDRKKSQSSTPPLVPNGLTNAKDDSDCKALGVICSSELDRVKSSRNETENQCDTTVTSGNSSGGSDSSHMKPPNTDAKRKQHNARRSRVRKLQYIAELERNAQALQVAGAEVSAQLEFFDQQNVILGMENRALKQRLESLSQEHFIKSMEQEILDKELARLQYLYHMQRNMNHHQQRQQRRKQNPAVHRRGRSYNDLDSQFSRVNIHPPRAVVANNATLQ